MTTVRSAVCSAALAACLSGVLSPALPVGGGEADVTAAPAAAAAFTDDRARAKQWEAYRARLAADPDVVRLYAFEEGAGELVRNEARGGEGALLLLGYSPYGVYRGEARLSPPAPADCPRWSEGRWPGKRALECGRAVRQVSRSGFYGTPDGRFTLSAWVYVPEPEDARATGDLNVGGELFSLGPAWGSGMRLSAEWRHWCRDGQLSFRLGIAKGVISANLRGFTFDRWHHIAALWDGTHVRLLLDGNESATPGKGPYVAPGSPNQREPENDTGGLAVGGASSASGMPQGLRFLIDEAVVYRRALAATELLAVHASFRPSADARQQAARRRAVAAGEAAREHYRLEFPRSTGGYLPVGQPLRVTAGPANGQTLPEEFRPAFLHGEFTLPDAATPAHRLSISLANASPDAPAELRFVPERCGLYTAKLTLADAQNRPLSTTVYPFAAVLASPAPTGADEALALGLQPGAVAMPGARACGLRLARVVLDWGRVEPKKGLYDWREADWRIAQAQASCQPDGTRPAVLLCLSGWPQWLTGNPAEPRLPAAGEWPRYQTLLDLLACRYRTEIAAWELWDGPVAPPRFYFRGQGGEAAYAQLVAQAAAALRRRSPGAVILGGGAPAEAQEFPAWVNRVYEQSGRVLNGLSYCYAPATPACPRPGLAAPGWNVACGNRQTAGDLGGLPLATLSAWGGDRLFRAANRTAVRVWPLPVFTPEDAAKQQVAQILCAFASGTRRVILNPGPDEYYPAENRSDGLPSRKGVAVAALAHAIAGSLRAHPLPVAGAPEILALLVERAALPPVLILCAPDALPAQPRPVTLHLPAGNAPTACRDWLGNPLPAPSAPQTAEPQKTGVVPVGDTPVYLELTTAEPPQFTAAPAP